MLKAQGRLSTDLGAGLVPSLVSQRHYLQPQSLTNQRLSKTAVRTLLGNLATKSVDLLAEYERTNKFPNQNELTTSLMTLEPDKGQTITLRNHQEQITALYQLLAGTGECIRRELCQWQAVLTNQMDLVLAEKELVMGVARYGLTEGLQGEYLLPLSLGL